MKKYLFILLLLTACEPESVTPIEPKIDNHVNTWTDGVIPFAFTDNMPKEQRGIILKAMETYERVCDVNYVRYELNDLFNLKQGFLIKYSGSVQSSIFPTGMPDYISEFRVSDIRFFNESVALHELGHNLGREHEQQLANALDYIIIDYDNLDPEWMGNFTLGETIFLTEFDYRSNMIYGSYDASIDKNKPVWTDFEGNTFEPSKTLTELDKLKYIELYGKATL